MDRRTVLTVLLSLLLLASVCTTALASDYDGDGLPTPADCDDLDGAVHPGAPDRPDLAFEDSNCDGIDGDAVTAVFVDAGGSDSRPGTREFPKRTITNALAVARAQGKDVYVSAGTYVESLALEGGVGIYGGYTPSFSMRVLDTPTTIEGAPAAVADGDKAVVLQLLTLRGTADASRNAYGLRAVNSSTVLLERTTASAGDGADGAPGMTPATPAKLPGADARSGADGWCTRGLWLPAVAGGARGAGPVDPVLGLARDGGTGGNGGTTSPAVVTRNGTPGGPAAGSTTGAGAAGLGDVNTAARDGGDGATGAPGASGAPGTNATFTAASALPATWVGGAATGGGPGRPGVGGGGGGGGGAQRDSVQDFDQGGASGGGGGGGGVGGGGGSPGASGGGSFGAYIAGAAVVAVDSTLRSGRGGRGGNGGNGGSGGPGGIGAAGGTAPACWIFGFGDGGRGGNGGVGGAGGPGGAGAGGPSAGVYRAGAGSAYVDHSSTASAGPGGSGGTRGNGGPAAASGASVGTLLAPGTPAGVSDFDGDGISDTVDGCPAVAASGTASGCPVRPARLVDTDSDGVPDAADRCPAASGGPADGCPPAPVLPLAPVVVMSPTPSAGGTLSRTSPALQRVNADVRWAFHPPTRAATRFARFDIRYIPVGATVAVSCRGRACPPRFRGKGYVKRNPPARLRLGKFTLRAGATITVAVTKPGAIGIVRIVTARPRKEPRSSTRCLPPGATKAVACPR